MPRIHREDAEQKALIQWADMTRMPSILALYPGDKIGDDLFAIPNGGARHRIEAARLKGLGVRRGVSDLELAVPVGKFHGLYIEMKAPKPHHSATSKEQKKFIARRIDRRYAAVVCYGFDEAKYQIEMYLAWQP